jgi:anti-sigma factor RsiW
MNNHTDIRSLLTLAAAGALDAAEQRHLEEHLRSCNECRAELAAWQRLTGALEALPTPQAPLGLVERTRRQMESRAAARAEHRRTRNLFVWLTVFAWASTLTSWLGFQFVGDKLAVALDLSFASLTRAWVLYTLVAWLATALSAGLLAKRSQEGRTV